MNRAAVGQIEVSVAMLRETAQNIMRKKKTISKGCEGKGKKKPNQNRDS